MADQTTLEGREKVRADYTEGSVTGAILKMGLPSMVGFLAQQLYLLADMFWISRLERSQEAVAGVTFFGSVLSVFFAINNLIGPGSIAVISRRYGEKDYDRTEKAIKETLVLKLASGLLFAAFGYFFLDDTLRLAGATGEAYAQGLAYGGTLILWLPILFATYSVFTAMRSVANPQMAMALMLGSNILNLGLDPVLMFGWFGLPAMGIAGAAWATVISFSLAFVIGVTLFYFDCTNVRLHVRSRIPMDIQSMWAQIRIGVPAWIGDVSFSLSRLVLTPIIATFGSAVVAAYGVGMQVFGLGFSFLVGIGLGVSSLIGQTVGSGKPERARIVADRSILLGVAVMTFHGLVVFVFAQPIMRIFFSDPTVITEGVLLLRIFAVGFPFYGAFFMTETVHYGVGLNTPVMIMATVHSWGFQVLPAFVLTSLIGFGALGVWWVLTAAGIVSAFVFYRYYRRGRWLTARV